MNEREFQAWLIKEIKRRLPTAIVIKTDPTYIQGLPDLLILYRNCWAALEVKRSSKAHHQPNQEFYVDRMNCMSFAEFIWPEIADEILDAMEDYLNDI